MVRRLWPLLRITGQRTTDTQYDPVYGLPRHRVEEWLARNPRLSEQYEVELRRRYYQ